jgi:hypothetical protein
MTPPSPRQFRRPPPGPGPTPTPGPAPGTLLHDSAIHTQLHNGIVRTVPQEGIYECRASGKPRIRTNADRTFSLLCDAGHGRFYTYVPNYNVYMVLVAGWGNQVAGQDISLKLRSRHNEPDPCNNRFGGYGFSFDRSGFSAKTEPCHNNHVSNASGSLPFKIGTGQFVTIEFSVKDEGTGVRQIAKLNGTQVMNKIIARQPAPQSLFVPRSYIWVRQNIDSGTGELRIKNLKLYAI